MQGCECIGGGEDALEVIATHRDDYGRRQWPHVMDEEHESLSLVLDN